MNKSGQIPIRLSARENVPWGSKTKRIPSPVLEDGEIVEDGQGFTTVTAKKKRDQYGSAVAVPQGNRTQYGDLGRLPLSNKTTNYLFPGPQQGHTSYTGIIDKQGRGSSYAAYSRPPPGVLISTAGGEQRKIRTAVSVAQSHASTARSAVYSQRPIFPTVAGHQGAERVRLTAQRDLATEKAQYRPGMIIFAVLHEQHWAEGRPEKMLASVASTTLSNQGRPIHSKERPMIVVALHDTHYVALPCFTHSCRGVGDRNADEYVSVFDYRSKQRIPQTNHRPLETEYLYENVNIMQPTCTAYITYPISRSYSFECFRHGYLTEKSTADLIRLYLKSIPVPASTTADDSTEVKIHQGRRNLDSAKRAVALAQEQLASTTRAGGTPAQCVPPLQALVKIQDHFAAAFESLLLAYENKLELQ
ncbi:hypothetical protein MMC13_002857 [Lambiella insularis]|nr:hypothetical protein [Lambiella insularis]